MWRDSRYLTLCPRSRTTTSRSARRNWRANRSDTRRKNKSATGEKRSGRCRSPILRRPHRRRPTRHPQSDLIRPQPSTAIESSAPTPLQQVVGKRTDPREAPLSRRWSSPETSSESPELMTPVWLARGQREFFGLCREFREVPRAGRCGQGSTLNAQGELEPGGHEFDEPHEWNRVADCLARPGPIRVCPPLFQRTSAASPAAARRPYARVGTGSSRLVALESGRVRQTARTLRVAHIWQYRGRQRQRKA